MGCLSKSKCLTETNIAPSEESYRPETAALANARKELCFVRTMLDYTYRFLWIYFIVETSHHFHLLLTMSNNLAGGKLAKTETYEIAFSQFFSKY